MREHLPTRRSATSFEVVAGTTKVTMTVGFFPNGKPAEVFVSNLKAGSQMEAVARDASVLLSIALQHGISLAEINKSLTQDASGVPSSVIGAIVRELMKGDLL